MPSPIQSLTVVFAAGIGALMLSASPHTESTRAEVQNSESPPAALSAMPMQSVGVAPQEMGRRLFEQNCAHCHGDDARGDEGPSLFNLKLSDARIAKRIKEGIKGEMPRFGEKFSESDITALIAFLRTLRD